MTGTCPCGGVLNERQRQVISARGMAKHGLVAALPITVETTECGACGRAMVVYYDAQMQKVVPVGAA